jgi:phospholipid transport system transporter-binding protein
VTAASAAAGAARARGGPAAGAAFELLRRSPGRFEARGALTFPTARRAWEEGMAALQADASGILEVDCAGVTVADSAGLVVLLDWLAVAGRGGRRLTYRYLPASLRSLAAISDLDEVLAHGFPPRR